MEDSAIQSVIIGFGYKAGSGKDEAVAEIIKQRSKDYNIKRYSFASELKKEVNRAALSCGGMEKLFTRPQWYIQENGNFLELPEWVVFDPNPTIDDPECGLGKQRLFLQWYGNEYRRSCNPKYWIDRVSKKIAEDNPEVALISDLRYLNEMEWIKQYGENIRIDRNIPAVNSHISEHQLQDVPAHEWSGIITNNGTLEQFKRTVVNTFDYIMENMP